MTTEASCARCGDCCDPVTSSHALEDLADEAPSTAFIKKHWHPIKRAEVIRRWPEFADVVEQGHFYECDAFDPVTRLCTAHQNRPPVCKNYPWYGQEPTVRGLPLRCSYWSDVEVELWPAGAQPLPVPA